MKSHHVKERPADNTTLNRAWLSQADHSKTHGGEVAEHAQGLHAGAQILDLRHRKRGVFGAEAGGALPDINQPGLVAVDQRLEEHAAHQREDGSVGAYAQRQREDHGGRKPWRSHERAEGYSQIAKEWHILTPILLGICITVANTKQNILNDFVCDELVAAVRFRTPLLRIRTPFRTAPSPSTRHSIRRVAYRNNPPCRSRRLRKRFRRQTGSRSTGPAQTRSRLRAPQVREAGPTRRAGRIRQSGRRAGARLAGQSRQTPRRQRFPPATPSPPLRSKKRKPGRMR